GTRWVGSQGPASRRPAAWPRTSSPGTAPSPHRTTVQPVSPRRSVACPTRNPGTSVRLEPGGASRMGAYASMRPPRSPETARPMAKALPAFERIWRLVADIPRGRVATYGQIARMAGYVNGARTVGWALRALPDERRIAGRRVPWHRVINAQGTISLRGRGDGGEADRQGAALRRGAGRFETDGR